MHKPRPSPRRCWKNTARVNALRPHPNPLPQERGPSGERLLPVGTFHGRSSQPDIPRGTDCPLSLRRGDRPPSGCGQSAHSMAEAANQTFREALTAPSPPGEWTARRAAAASWHIHGRSSQPDIPRGTDCSLSLRERVGVRVSGAISRDPAARLPCA